MAASLAVTFTLISCVRGSLCIIIKISGILFSRLSVALNCKRGVKNPQDLYVIDLRKYGTTVGHVLCIISCICTLFFNSEAWCPGTDPGWGIRGKCPLPSETSQKLIGS